MKKATFKVVKPTRAVEPTRASLRELPEVKIGDFVVHRNRFAARVARVGIRVRHDGPSQASLAEIPEVDLGAARRRRNPFAKWIDPSALQIRIGRGRPALGEEGGPTVSRSIRLPQALADALELLAKHEGITVHALMRRTLADRVRAALLRTQPAVRAAEGRPPGRSRRGGRG